MGKKHVHGGKDGSGCRVRHAAAIRGCVRDREERSDIDAASRGAQGEDTCGFDTSKLLAERGFELVLLCCAKCSNVAINSKVELNHGGGQ